MVIATCGHELKGEEFDYSYSWKETTRDARPAIAYGSLCPKCAKDFKKYKILIKKFHFEKGEIEKYQDYELVPGVSDD